MNHPEVELQREVIQELREGLECHLTCLGLSWLRETPLSQLLLVSLGLVRSSWRTVSLLSCPGLLGTSW